VQELLGSDLPTTIRLFRGYVDHDFDAATGVFAEIQTSLNAIWRAAPRQPAVSAAICWCVRRGP